VLEIHEDIWLEAESRTTLDELSRLGCRLAIDGFGTGQSSLPWLARLPVDQLKLGHTFVAELGNTSGDRGGDTSRDAGGRGGGTDNRHSDDAWSLISGIVELSRCLVLPVIAQGVEDRLTRDTLAAAGCTACQGYGLAPLTARYSQINSELTPEHIHALFNTFIHVNWLAPFALGFTR